MNEHERLGQEILEYLFKILMIDERWTVREPLGFTWWAYHLPQRVWVEPLQRRTDPAVRVHAETALLRKIPTSHKVQAALDVLNKTASLNTYRWDPQTERVTSRCSGYVTAETIDGLKAFIASAIALQVADAHVKGQPEFAQLLDSEIDSSNHPSQGRREQMDDMLNVIDGVFAPRGQGNSPFIADDFTNLQKMEPTPSVLTTSSPDGATAEFAYYTPEPATFLKFFQKRSPVQTALCQVLASVRHPQLGSGAFWKLTLPLDMTEEQAKETATELNFAEFTVTPEPYFHNFGAWCSDPQLKALAYVMFMPAVVCKPNILPAFLWSMWARTEWAKKFLTRSSANPGTA